MVDWPVSQGLYILIDSIDEFPSAVLRLIIELNV